MNKLLAVVTAVLTNGEDHQAFVGAKWLVILLRVVPRHFQRALALRILALSPHYFYRHMNPVYQNMPTKEWIEAEYNRNRLTREKLCDQVLLPHVKPDFRILDIGCGAGFLARAIAPHVKRVYGCDISEGVLECARVINNAPNITYLYSGEPGFKNIENASLDLICSFAVIQHMRESVIQSIFLTSAAKLRTGGRCLFQVQFEHENWKSEYQWTDDRSVTGKLKLKFGLNCFSRSASFFEEAATNVGLSTSSICPMSELLDDSFDDVSNQHMIVLFKP